jgi:hypothetical protein
VGVGWQGVRLFDIGGPKWGWLPVVANNTRILTLYVKPLKWLEKVQTWPNKTTCMPLNIVFLK